MGTKASHIRPEHYEYPRSDIVTLFVRTACDVRPHLVTKRSELWHYFLGWCEEHRSNTVTYRIFWRTLYGMSIGIRATTLMDMDTERRTKYVFGIGPSLFERGDDDE